MSEISVQSPDENAITAAHKKAKMLVAQAYYAGKESMKQSPIKRIGDILDAAAGVAVLKEVVCPQTAEDIQITKRLLNETIGRCLVNLIKESAVQMGKRTEEIFELMLDSQIYRKGNQFVTPELYAQEEKWIIFNNIDCEKPGVLGSIQVVFDTAEKMKLQWREDYLLEKLERLPEVPSGRRGPVSCDIMTRIYKALEEATSKENAALQTPSPIAYCCCNHKNGVACAARHLYGERVYKK